MESAKTSQPTGDSIIAVSQAKNSESVSSKRNEELAIPSLRTTLAEAFERMFAFERGRGVSSVIVFALSVATFSWFIDSCLPVVQEAGHWLTTTFRGDEPQHHFLDLFAKLALPFLLFICMVCGLAINAYRNTLPRRYDSEVPDTHRGLIIQLSDYNSRGPGVQSCYSTAEEIKSAALSGSLNIAEVLKSNWGQAAFAIRYHAPVLKYCWILCTKGERGSGKDFAAAERMVCAVVKSVSGRDATCFQVEIDDENDIGHAAQRVSDIYHQLSEYAPDLRNSDVIADFTGGTAAMSGGMILATLQEEREIEYIRRGVTLQSDIDAAVVLYKQIIISPRTSHGMINAFSRR